MIRGLIAAMALAAAGGCEPDFERMVDQPRLDSYEATDLFPDGKTMRTPPAGTVARGEVIGPPALVDGVVAGVPVDRIPLAVDLALVRHGRDRFDIFCAVCHGTDGFGKTQVSENMVLRPPPSLHLARLRQAAPGHLYAVVRHGYGMMPSYAARLSVRDRWAVVAYVQALQLSQRAALRELPAAQQKEAESWLR